MPDEAESAIQREIARESLLEDCARTVDDRLDRWFEIGHQAIIGAHHFSAASSECLGAYRDGHFIGTVMMTQAVNEGIIRFIAERRGVPRVRGRWWHERILDWICRRRGDTRTMNRDELVAALVENGAISKAAGDDSLAIARSFRNDVHHMNPTVAKIDFKELARKNLAALARLEADVFGSEITEPGKLTLKHPEYWEVGPDGTTPAFLRLIP